MSILLSDIYQHQYIVRFRTFIILTMPAFDTSMPNYAFDILYP